MKPLNDVIAACPPSGIRKFFDIAAEREDVISLGVGEPDFVTPWRVREAGIYALEHGYTTYTSNAGLPHLRELICADLAARYGAEYSWTDECLITTGVSEGLDLALRVLLNPGDEVIVPEPCYVAYEPCIAFAGGVPVRVPTRWEDGFAVDAAVVEAAVTPRTKAVLLGSPANPTGAVQPRAALEALVRLAERRDLYLVSDEIYDRLTYDTAHTCLGTLAPDRTVLLGGFSKAHAMTGWRVGWIIGPKDVVKAATNLQSHATSNVSNVAQVAALAAVAGDLEAVAEMRQAFDRRRRTIVRMLNEIDGVLCPEPEGAFYAYPSVKALLGKEIRGKRPQDTVELAALILEEAEVAVVPGEAFGTPGYLRLSYALGDEDLIEGVSRIQKLLAEARD